MIKKVILTGTTYEVGDFMGEGVIAHMQQIGNSIQIMTKDPETERPNNQHSFPLRDGDFIRYEDDSIETFKFGDHEDGDDL